MAWKYGAKNQKGSVAIYITLLVLIVIMLISFSWAGVMINEIKVSREIGFAAPAYYAAEAGMERGLYQVRYGIGMAYNSGSGNQTLSGALSSGAAYEVIWDGDDSIHSTGEFENTWRTIEAHW